MPGELATRIPLLTGISRDIINPQDTIIAGDGKPITVKQLNDVIKQVNYIVDEIDDKISGRSGGIGSDAGMVANKHNTGGNVFVNDSEAEIVSVSFTTTGGPVLIWAYTQIKTSSDSDGGAEKIHIEYNIKRDSTAVTAGDDDFNWEETDSFTVQMPIILIGYDSPAAGTYSYSMNGTNIVNTNNKLHVENQIFVAELAAAQT